MHASWTNLKKLSALNPFNPLTPDLLSDKTHDSVKMMQQKNPR